MKNFKIYIILICCFFIFIKCNKQLELVPLGELDENTFYQTEEHFESATLSPYSTLLNLHWNNDGYGWMEGVVMQDDDMIPSGGTSNDQEDFNWTPSNGHFKFLWGEAYKGIQRANVIITRLPEAKQFQDETKKARYEAEARFLRAYFHFLLAVNWGTPPVITKEVLNLDESFVSNSQPGEIWDVIISDLSFAKENLPEQFDEANTGRATKWAASALLGKVFLHRAQWEGDDSHYESAVTHLTDVVNSGQYSLVDNFGENFSVDHKNNPESIFEVQFSYNASSGDNTWLANDFGTPGNQNVGTAASGKATYLRPACGPTNVCAPGANSSAYGKAATSSSLMNEIEPNDPRRPYTFFMDGDPYMDVTFDSEWSVTGSTPSKYVLGTPFSGWQPNYDLNNERMIRYADVLLMLAEAKLLANDDVAGAAGLINEVRERADPTGTILTPRSDAVSVDQMFEWLMHERRIELAFEGHRYYDLVRWHRAGLIDIQNDVDFGRTQANTSWNPLYLLKPIPLSELDINRKLSQNPGFN